MEIIVQAVLALVLCGTAFGAIRQLRRARLNPSARSLQRATLALCAEVMANDNNTARARGFARQIALFTMSDKVLIGLGRDHAEIRKNMEDLKRSGGIDHDAALSEADKQVVQPLLHVFALTCLLHNPKYSRQIVRVWEEVTARAFASANAAAMPKGRTIKSPPVATSASKPVQDKIHRVEDQVLERLNNLCAA